MIADLDVDDVGAVEAAQELVGHEAVLRGVEAGVPHRDGHLRGQHLEHADAIGREGPGGELVLEIEDTERAAPVVHRGGEHGARAHALEVGVSTAVGARDALDLKRVDASEALPAEQSVVQRGLAPQPMLVDFGIAKTLEPGTLSTKTTAGDVLGTPFYMSPEHVRSSKSVDTRSDQYALGVVLYEAVTGLLPYRETSSLFALMASITRGDALRPSRIRADLPASFEAVILRAMHVDREKRYATVRDLGRALFPFASAVTQAAWASELGPRREAPSVRPPPPPPSVQVRIEPSGLRRIAALEACTDLELEMFAMVAPARGFRAGATIFEQGEPAESCFLLLEGEVDVVKQAGGRSHVLNTLRPGAVVGQMALIDKSPRTATVVARTAAVLVEVAGEMFHRLLGAHTELALRFREQIAVAGIRQLRRATLRMAELAGGGRVSTPSHPTRSLSSELVYMQAAATEWDLAIDLDGEDGGSA